MGQKVNPVGLRIGISRDWNSRWYANNKDFATFLDEDIKIRKFLEKKLKACLVSHIEIERIKGKIKVSIFTAAPGMVLGQEAKNIKELKKEVSKLIKLKLLTLMQQLLLKKWQRILKNVLHSEVFKRWLLEMF